MFQTTNQEVQEERVQTNMDNGTTKIQDQHRPTENMDKYGTFGTRFYWLHIWDRPRVADLCAFGSTGLSGDLPSGDSPLCVFRGENAMSR